jgi:translation initiation factor IF-3
MALMARIKEDLAGMAVVEQEAKLQGKSVTMTLAPLPSNKRKRRFFSQHDLPPLEDEEDDEDEDEDEDEEEEMEEEHNGSTTGK